MKTSLLATQLESLIDTTEITIMCKLMHLDLHVGMTAQFSGVTPIGRLGGPRIVCAL